MARRKIKHIVIHHTASPKTQTPKDIIRYHKEVNGWRACGYHRIYSPDRKLTYVTDRLIDNDQYLDDFERGAGVAGYNSDTVHYSIIGNYQTDTLDDIDIKNIIQDMRILKERYKPTDGIVPHCYFGGTACPGKNILSIIKKFQNPEQTL